MKDTGGNKAIKTYFFDLVSALTDIYDEREARTIAQYVLEDAFGIFSPLNSERVFNLDERVLFEKISEELLKKRPWQYVLGEADFYGLKFKVDENVLIPRAETEELVHVIIKRHKSQKAKILDVGTGSGCIAVSLKKNMKNAVITAVDVSKGALEVAQANAIKNKVEVEFQELDILDVKTYKKKPQYDLIVSNPPYIQEAEVTIMPDHVLDHEPHMALFVTNHDPMQFYKAISDFAFVQLRDNGWLYFEINEFFGKEVLELLERKGFINCELLSDMFDRNRIVLGQLPSNSTNQ